MGPRAGKKRGKAPAAGGKPAKKPKKQATRADEDVPAPEVDSDVEVNDDDMAFVTENASAMGFLTSLDSSKLKSAAKKPLATPRATSEAGTTPEAGTAPSARSTEDDDSDGEAAYERRPRGVQADAHTPKADALPTKGVDGALCFDRSNSRLTPAGAVRHVAGVTMEETWPDPEEARQPEEASERAGDGSGPQAGGTRGNVPQDEAHTPPPRPGPDDARVAAIKELQAVEDMAQRRVTLKQQMAMSASKLIEAPEANIGELKALLQVVADPDQHTARLAMLTCLAVFRDIAPGYRIRPAAADAEGVTLTKEVARLRAFEAALLTGYQGLLKALLAASGGKGSNLAHARIAVKSMAGLLTGLMHFNYTSDLLQALVPKMAHADEVIRIAACSAISEVCARDVAGVVALEGVQLVADLIRTRRCVVPACVLRALFRLTFPDVAPPSADGSGGANTHKKLKKKLKAKRRKADDVSEDLAAAEAGPDREQAAIQQSQTLEALFEILFRVLKQCTSGSLLAAGGAHGGEAAAVTSDRVHKRFPLLAPALEGLGRYTHFISVEYFSDLMDVFQQLLSSPHLPLPERLRCVLSASDILRGHGEAIAVDRRALYTQLYAAVLSAPLTPLTEAEDEAYLAARSEIADAAASVVYGRPDGRPAAGGAVAAAAADGSLDVLLVRALDQILTDSRATDIPRLAAFVKRMLAVCLGSAPGPALGMLCMMSRLLLRHPRLRGMLDGEGVGGVGSGAGYDPTLPEPSEAGALRSPLWELALAGLHYHPHVAQMARSVAAISPDGGGASPVAMPFPAASQPAEVCRVYNVANKGGFRPAPSNPKTRRTRSLIHLATKDDFSPAFRAVVGEGGGGGSSEDGGGQEREAVTTAFQRFYRESSRHRENGELHTALAVSKHRVRLFLAHLKRTKQQEKPKKAKKDRSSGGSVKADKADRKRSRRRSSKQ